jgi:hypothetical protein
MGLGAESALSGIVHPGLHEGLEAFYPTVGEIQSATVVVRPNGERVESWATVLVVYGNMARPRQAAGEVREVGQTRVTTERVFNVAGYYPQIEVGQRAYIDNQAWNITAVTSDSMSRSTQLELERVGH